MNDNDGQEAPGMTALTLAAHDHNVKVFAQYVDKLARELYPKGLTPEAMIEGAVKGSAAAFMAARGVSRFQVGDILQAMADGMREQSYPHAVD